MGMRTEIRGSGLRRRTGGEWSIDEMGGIGATGAVEQAVRA